MKAQDSIREKASGHEGDRTSASGADIEVSVVMPCLNEASTIRDAIALAQEFLDRMGGGEIVVSDNGSTDGSVEIAQKAGARVVHGSEKGYGFALMNGINASRGTYIVMGDADSTYDFREAEVMIEKLREGYDLVMGSRLRGSIAPGAMPFLHRWLGTPVLTFLINRFFGLGISDCNCGLRAFTREAYKRLDLVSGGMEFASEMVIKAALLKLKVAEIPCSLRTCNKDRQPHLNTWRDGWRHLRFILLFAPHIVFTVPGVFFLVIGLLLSAPVLFTPVQLFGRTFDYHLLFYGLPLIHLGYQAVWFASLESRFVRFSGLLKPTASLLPKRTIEFWLMMGLLLGIAGVGCLLAILVIWVRAGFGALNEVRLGALGISLSLLSIQTIMNALMAGMLDIKTR